MIDSQTKYEAFVRLCRTAQSHREPRDFFAGAAGEICNLTGCEHVRLVVAAKGPPRACGFTADPELSDIPAAELEASAARQVLEQDEPRLVSRQSSADAFPDEQRLWDQNYRACFHLPLACRGDTVGVLTLAWRREEPLTQADRVFLDDLATLLGLVLDDLAAHQRVTELERFQRESSYLRGELRSERDLRSLTGESPAMKAVRLAIQQVARTDSTVLVLGETGTGKELVARAIHQLGPRREHLLVTVNCAALAPGVIASELFGHEQGAFTGATRRRIGRFELAHRGTLFLDEIGELPPETQVLLLRVLQERVIERVGGQSSIPVDVRVIAATHRDLMAAIHEGRFRTDLYFRLNVFPILMPPLRERREDVPDLVRHFLHHFGRRMNRPITRVSPASLKLLTDYHWPGNVRELENLIERAMIVAAGDTLEIDPSWLRPVVAEGGEVATSAALADVERRAILDALERCRGKIYGPTGAAAVLNLRPTTLYGKMRKLGIERPAR